MDRKQAPSEPVRLEPTPESLALVELLEKTLTQNARRSPQEAA